MKWIVDIYIYLDQTIWLGARGFGRVDATQALLASPCLMVVVPGECQVGRIVNGRYLYLDGSAELWAMSGANSANTL